MTDTEILNWFDENPDRLKDVYVWLNWNPDARPQDGVREAVVTLCEDYPSPMMRRAEQEGIR